MHILYMYKKKNILCILYKIVKTQLNVLGGYIHEIYMLASYYVG